MAAALLGPLRSIAQESPGKLGLLVMLKVLTYDASFDKRGEGPFVILVPYAAPAQLKQARELVSAGQALETDAIHGRTLQFEPVALADLETEVTAKKAAAVLVPSELPSDSVKQVTEVAQHHKLYSMSFDESLVKGGLVIGVGTNSAGKPQVIINVVAARTIGAEFNSTVMKVARVYQ